MFVSLVSTNKIHDAAVSNMTYSSYKNVCCCELWGEGNVGFLKFHLHPLSSFLFYHPIPFLDAILVTFFRYSPTTTFCAGREREVGEGWHQDDGGMGKDALDDPTMPGGSQAQEKAR